MSESSAAYDNDQNDPPPKRKKTRGASRPPKSRVVAEYEYRDEQNNALFQVLRTEDKEFPTRRPTANGKGWIWNLGNVRRVPYHLPQLIEAVARGDVVYIVEGEKDVQSVEAAGAPATCNPGGTGGGWKDEYSKFLEGADVVIVVNKDENGAGRKHATKVAASLEGVAARVRLAEARTGKDVSDHLGAGHALDELVPLDPEGLPLAPDENGAGLLDDLLAFVRQYWILSEHQLVIIVVWIVHSHAIAAADMTPYLCVTSPEKRSGKSRIIEIARPLVRKPLATANISPAVMFRVIAAEQSTALIDEADGTFGKNGRPSSERGEDIRQLLNTGFARGMPVRRMVGQGAAMEPREFDAFGAKLIAGIGDLPDTVSDRSIPIRMQRKLPQERVKRFRFQRHARDCQPLHERLRSWAARRLDVLALAEPVLPDVLDDRAQDIVEPLLAIADEAGGDWPQKVRDAAVALLVGRDGEGDASWGVRLLADIRNVFKDEGVDKLASKDLAENLNASEDAPWGGWRDGKGIDPRTIAKLLKPFDVVPGTVKFSDGSTAKGYHADKLEGAWKRYAPSTGGSERHPVTSQSPSGFSADSLPSPAPQGDGNENAEIPVVKREVTASEDKPAQGGPDDVTARIREVFPDAVEEPAIEPNESIRLVTGEFVTVEHDNPWKGSCYRCRGTEFWTGSAGQPVCVRCHPKVGG